MTLYAYKTTLFGDRTTPEEHNGVLFAENFQQAMAYLSETYDPEMGEVYLAAVDDTYVVELIPEEYERITSEGGFYDGYTVL